MPKRELFDLNCTIAAETPAAVLINDGINKVWLPRSQIEIDERGDGTFDISMPVWLAKDKELI
jgi:hypothetical protein